MCSRREQELVKTFTTCQELGFGRSWQAGRRWERCRRQSGAGGSSFPRITAVSGVLYFCENNGTSAAWTMPLSWPENNAPIFDSSYRKCYNKYNDDNKNVICHQSPKFALYGVFAFSGIKSRRTPENAVQRSYIKYGNTKTGKRCGVG